MQIPFVKYSGCGNDFILIDNRFLGFSFSPTYIQKLCHRHQGIGADGVLLLEPPKASKPSHKMRIFNADGSEAEMCGNGLRCLAQHIRSIENKHSPFFIETMHQQIKVSFQQDLVTIAMPPYSAISQINLTIQSTPLVLHFLDTGVPHAVILANVEAADYLLSLAPVIRFHSVFPRGTNVNIVSLLPDSSIAVRTYERGVEKETLACGTGAAAAAIVAAINYHLPSPITVHTRSGDPLHIGFRYSDSQFPLEDSITLTGPAIKIFEGIVSHTLLG